MRGKTRGSWNMRSTPSRASASGRSPVIGGRQNDVTRISGVVTARMLSSRRLAGTVRADEADKLALVDSESYVAQALRPPKLAHATDGRGRPWRLTLLRRARVPAGARCVRWPGAEPHRPSRKSGRKLINKEREHDELIAAEVAQEFGGDIDSGRRRRSGRRGCRGRRSPPC